MTDTSELLGSGISKDPAVGLRAVAALRRLVERLEDLQVQNARTQGWSWADIAGAVGVSKQAMHKKHARRLASEPERGALMFERFTEAARGVVVNAYEQARTLGHSEILAEDVLLGVMADTEGVGARVLRDLGVEQDALMCEVAAFADADTEALRSIGVDLHAVRRQAEGAFGAGALDRPRRRRVGLSRRQVVLVGGHLDFADTTSRALKQALREAQALDHDYVGSEHILLGLLSDEQDPAARVLARLGLEPAAVRQQVLDELQRTA